MKRLLNTLYVLTPENSLFLDNENVVVKRGNQNLANIPLHTIESIYSFTYKGATPALMGACAERGINLVFYSPNGKFLARINGKERGNIFLRMEQFRISCDRGLSCKFGKNFILGKIYNERWVIERAKRDHPDRVPVEVLKERSDFLADSIKKIKECENLDSLQGIEGKAAQTYFDSFDYFILQQKEFFSFKNRNRRPPLMHFFRLHIQF